jgi:hypothetical protein
MAKLTTTIEVIKALGGHAFVAERLGVTEKAVKHWGARGAKFPAHTYLDILEELSKRGLMADIALWNFSRAPTPRRKLEAAP